MKRTNVADHIEAIVAAYPNETLQQIGDRYGVTRERIRQVLAKQGITGRAARPRSPRVIQRIAHSNTYQALKKLFQQRWDRSEALRILGWEDVTTDTNEELCAKIRASFPFITRFHDFRWCPRCRQVKAEALMSTYKPISTCKQCVNIRIRAQYHRRKHLPEVKQKYALYNKRAAAKRQGLDPDTIAPLN